MRHDVFIEMFKDLDIFNAFNNKCSSIMAFEYEGDFLAFNFVQVMNIRQLYQPFFERKIESIVGIPVKINSLI